MADPKKGWRDAAREHHRDRAATIKPVRKRKGGGAPRANYFRHRNLLTQCLRLMAGGRLLTREFAAGGVCWAVGGRRIPEAVARRASARAEPSIGDRTDKPRGGPHGRQCQSSTR
jgi:hypothetical protein